MQSRLPQSRIRNELFVILTKDLYSLLGKICCFKITTHKYKNAGEGKMAKTMQNLCFPVQAVTSDKILLSVLRVMATVELLILLLEIIKELEVYGPYGPDF